jgi:SAM-dependent methyltransferase
VTVGLPASHEHLTFMTPLSQGRADRLVRFIADGSPATILDIGCGWAELLLQAVAAVPRAHGVGVDLDEPAIEHGRRLARDRGLAERVELLAEDARTAGPSVADAVICIGASQIWGPPVELAQPIDYSSALAALHARVPRGGRVVYGEGIWSAAPTDEAVAPLAGRHDEFVTLAELADLAAGHGFAVMAVHEASLDEWDEFESGYSARFAAWLAGHDADDPQAAEVAERAQRQRTAYLGGYRGILGLAYLQLVAL